MSPRQGRDQKTFWTRIGTAWQNDAGRIQLVFDALPIPDSEGRVVANLFEPRDNSGGQRTHDPVRADRASTRAAAELDDEVPF